MASQSRLRLPDVPLALGDGNHLPPASGSVDLLTHAQAWHWTDPRKSVPEAVTHLANLAGYSDFLVRGQDATRAFLSAERGLLRDVFPDGTVEERYVVSLAVAAP